MSEMIDRVARAIANVANPDCPPDCFEGQARAAIAAMREPTQEMIRIGENGLRHSLDYDAIDIWESQIDEALK